MARTEATDQVCSEAWKRALWCFGTAEIFLARARRYRRGLNALSFMGIAVPLLVGGIVLTFGTASSYLTTIIVVAGVLGLIQLLVSAASVVYGWADNLEYSHESGAENLSLSDAFKELAQTASQPPANLVDRFAVVKARDEARRGQDTRKGVTEKELRFGHRAGLRHFLRKCDSCGLVPDSMKATDCSFCGRF